jgi:hypothetical protein
MTLDENEVHRQLNGVSSTVALVGVECGDASQLQGGGSGSQDAAARMMREAAHGTTTGHSAAMHAPPNIVIADTWSTNTTGAALGATVGGAGLNIVPADSASFRGASANNNNEARLLPPPPPMGLSPSAMTLDVASAAGVVVPLDTPTTSAMGSPQKLAQNPHAGPQLQLDLPDRRASASTYHVGAGGLLGAMPQLGRSTSLSPAPASPMMSHSAPSPLPE